MCALSASSGRPRVLVVALDATLRERARGVLETERLEVVEAESVSKLGSLLDRQRPSLILIDFDAIERQKNSWAELRQRYACERMPILVAVALDDPAAVGRARQAGATDLVGKPIRWSLLAHRVRFLLDATRSLAELRFSQDSLVNAQRLAHLGSWELHASTDQMRWSDETYEILGLKPGEGKPTLGRFLDRVHPEDRETVQEQLEDVLLVGRFGCEHRVQLSDSTVRHVRLQGEAMFDDPSTGTRVAGTVQDVTEQRQAQEKIRYLANYDSLTGLANRHRFIERVQEAIDDAKSKDHFVAVLYMDLDKFKRINDTLGHSAGDQLLQSVADLLRHHVRRTDIIGRTANETPEISRLGGDEFTMLLSKLTSPQDAGDIARRVMRALPSPITIDGQKISTTGSIGIAVYPLDGEDVNTLLRHADTAMYHAKEQGRNNFQFFDDSMNIASMRRFRLESGLRSAAEKGQLRILYQPRVNLRSGEVNGMEALLRWDHPEFGAVSPKEFIPVAEETGLIVALGEWALVNACQQNKAWQEAGYRRVSVSVNVSTRQLTHADLRDTVARALQRSGLNPQDLELEITESAMMQDDEATAVVLRDLKAMGVRVALDDFGTGYSSLSYLARFPLDTLKLDRCFVRDVDTNPAAAGIATAVIRMAHSLDLHVVAEGVDAEDQARFLREKGCDELQGFLFAGPMTAEECVRFLVKERARRR